MSHLYHTRPLDLLKYVAPDDHVFAEIDPILQSEAYLGAMMLQPSSDVILDCGVGASPNLEDPTGHTSKDPHWAASYLAAMLKLYPRVVVVPDVLGDAVKTRKNLSVYSFVIEQLECRQPDLLYVIQGLTRNEAQVELEFACSHPDVKYIGFPRIVQYYNEGETVEDPDHLAQLRIEFVGLFLYSIRKAGKFPHLLGMNNIDELKWAGKHRVRMDTRMASMAAIHNLEVTGKRPGGLKIDLTAALTPTQIQAILNNIKTLDDIYYGS